jgi:iron(III) transport system substrate-binding protein
MDKSDHSGRSAKKSAISTTIAVILTAIIVGSVVGGATSYIFMSRTDSTVQEVRADLRAVADAAGIPINNPDEMKKLVEERKLIEAAKQEGKVVVDTFSLLDGTPELRSAFERRYPFITVEIRQATATEVANRFLSEYEKGTKAADVITLGTAALFDILQKPDSLAKYVPKDIGWLPADLKDKDGRWASHVNVPFAIAYNTKLVPKAEAPKSYMDLLDPKWTGKIGAFDPKAAPASPPTWKTMEKQFGEDFIRRLAAQKIKYYATGTNV